MSRILIVLFLSVCIHREVNGIKVLGIISLGLKSHYMAFKPLFENLAALGHEVTVMTHFPSTTYVQNLNEIDLSTTKTDHDGILNITSFEIWPKTMFTLFNFYRHSLAARKIKEDCDNLFTNREVKKILKSKQNFDVIYVEQFLSDCGLAFASAFYGSVPVIGITSHVMLPISYGKFGLPYRLASDAFYFNAGGYSPTTYEKLEALLLNCYFNTVLKWSLQRSIQSSLDEHLPNASVDLEKATSNMQMLFSYQFFPLTGTRVLSQQILEIGGLHIKNSKPLPRDLDSFISSAENGVIFFSFGSKLKQSTMSREKLDAFASAFAEIPQKVLWKVENDTVQNTENILTREWFPQLDILCHSNIIGFISHGGMLGTSEAIHCGVPIIVIPFFGDQFANAASIRDSGLGVILFFQDTSKQSLLEALNDLTSKRRQERAKELSVLWKDRPLSAMDSAVYWTQYIARHKSWPAESRAKHITLFDDLLIDVYLVLALILFAFGLLMYFLFVLFRTILRCARLLACNRKRKTD